MSMNRIREVLDRPWLVALALFIGAFVVRIAFVALVVGLDTPPLYDAEQYDLLAQTLLTTGVFGLTPEEPSSLRMPLFPLILAGTYAVFGHSYVAVRIALCTISSLTVVLTYFLGRSMFSPLVGLIAGGLVLVYPNTVYWSAFLLTEGFATLGVTLSAYLMLSVRRTASVWSLIGASICISALYLTKPEFLILYPLVPAWSWLTWHDLKKTVRVSAYLLSVASVCIALWSIRNYYVNDAFVLATTGSGRTFEGAHNDEVWSNPTYYGYWSACDRRPDCQLSEDSAGLARDQEGWRVGIAYVSTNLEKLPLMLLRKLLRFWVWPPASLGRVGDLIYAVLMPLALFGFARAWWGRPENRPYWPAMIFLGATFNTLVFYGSARFRAPIEPLILIFSVYGVVQLRNRALHWWRAHRPSEAEIT